MPSEIYTHPEIEQSFLDGDFVVQRQDRYGFSSVACDMAIEQTVNRDSKTKGGMKGLTLNKGAVNRWLLSHHQRAAIAKECQRMAGKGDSDRTRKDLDQTQIEKHENAVNNIVSTIQSMTNPFGHQGDELINLSSGCVAPVSVKADLMGAYDKGKNAAKQFEDSRLKTDSAKMFEPIKANKLKTFATGLKTASTKVQSETILLRASSEMFNRLLIIGKSRDIDLKELLSYALTPVPLSLGTGDGTMCKTDKSKLMHELEKGTECTPGFPSGSALIVDGMAFIQQQVHNIPPTFGQLADKLLNDLMSMAKGYGCSQIHFVCDMYPPHSIKTSERERRAASGAQLVKVTRPDQKTPKQFKRYLALGANKEGLIEFMFESWVKCDPSVLGHVSLVMSHSDKCHSFSLQEGSFVVSEIPELFSDHEEADTRLLLHANHAARDFNSVVIKSPDTDVFILSLAVAHEFHGCDLLFLTGSGNSRRIVNVSEIAKRYTPEECKAILGMHVFTGCDSISAFKGKGKVKPLELLLKNDEFVQCFAMLGTDWETPEALMAVVERFVCAMYGQKDCALVNVARFNLFRFTCRSDQFLPPNKDCLENHLKRANYQAAVHRRCLLPCINAPSPVGHGWDVKDDNLVFVWMANDPAPQKVLKTVHCKCPKSGCKGTCSCSRSGLPCTDLCQCLSEICNNRKIADQTDHEIVSESDSDSDIDD